MQIIIEGAGEVGTHLAKMLSEEVNDITVIDSDKERLAALSMSVDVMTVDGEVSSIETLRQAGVEDADLFIGVNPHTNQEINIVSAILAKRLGCRKVIARIDNEEYQAPENKYLFTDMGIDMLFYPEKLAATEIISLLRRNASSESMEFARGKLQLSVFRIDEDSPIVNYSVGEIGATYSKGNNRFIITAISRDGETIIPNGSVKVMANDQVYIMTKRDGVRHVMDVMGKTEINVEKVMIMGGGQIGRLVALSAAKEYQDVKVIDIDREKCLALSEETPDNVNVVNGDGRNPDFLSEENMRDFDAFIAVTGSDEANIMSCVMAKKSGMERVIAEVENTEYIKLAEDMGVDAIINKKLLTAGGIFKMTLSDKVHTVKYMSGTNAEVLEYIVPEGSPITKAPIKDLDLPKDYIIGGVIHDRETTIAGGLTQIQAYDRVVVFALPKAVKEGDRFFRETSSSKSAEKSVNSQDI